MINFPRSLIEGHRAFLGGRFAAEQDRYRELAATGQSPTIMVIGCVDSRVSPEVIFDAAPGEIFVVRNIAALVPPFEEGGGRHGVSAAIEFAVNQLEVPEIVIMGHGSCGGVNAALTQNFAGLPNGEGGFIGHWVDLLDTARDRIVAEHGHGDEATRELELETVRVSLTNLRTFPRVAEREAAGQLTLRGAYFAIRDGVLWVMDESGTFAPA